MKRGIMEFRLKEYINKGLGGAKTLLGQIDAYKEGISEALYILIFIGFYIDAFLHTTMFVLEDHTQLHLYMRITLMVYIYFKLAVSKERSAAGAILSSIAIAAFLFANARRSKYEVLLTIILLIIGAERVNFRRIIAAYFICGVTMMIIMMTAAQLGYIENLVYNQRNKGIRIAFGSIYPTDFTAHIYYLILAWVYLRGERLRYIELGIFALSAVFMYVFCKARLNALLVLVLIGLLLWYKIGNAIAKRNNRSFRVPGILQKLAVWSVPICALLILALTMGYNPNSTFWVKMNSVLNNRLMMGKQGIDQYGFSIFGQRIPMSGFGGTTVRPETYFFLDSSYVNILLRMGTLVFLVICIMYVIMYDKTRKSGDMILLMLLVCVALQCTIEHHMLEIAYNPFTLLVFAQAVPSGCKNGSLRERFGRKRVRQV